MMLGIDLGTTRCSALYRSLDRNDNIVTNIINIAEAHGTGLSMPSVVSFDKGEIKHGFQALKCRENVIFDAKRFLGRTYNEYEKLFSSKNNQPFQIVNVDNKPRYNFKFENQIYNLLPEHISGLLLRKIKTIAMKYTNEIKGCVITVPAHFSNVQREATMVAAELAGLNVIQLLNEPSAAAIAYGEHTKNTGIVLIFDFGGGTLDISVVDLSETQYDIVGYGGDQILGGRDIDNLIMNYALEQFYRNFYKQPRSERDIKNLLQNCEEAKIYLSSVMKTEISSWDNDESIVLTREKLNELCKPLFEKAIKTIENVLNNLSLNRSDINEIIMTGGTSGIPLIKKMVEDYFGGIKAYCFEPELAIAKGAAIIAYKNEAILNDVVRYPIGIYVVDGKTNEVDKFYQIIERCVKLPFVGTREVCTREDNQEAMTISVAEGESDIFSMNVFIGEFTLRNLPLKKKHEVTVSVTISVDKSGLLDVEAKVQSTGQSEKRQMRREGYFYKDGEKLIIKNMFNSLVQKYLP